MYILGFKIVNKKHSPSPVGVITWQLFSLFYRLFYILYINKLYSLEELFDNNLILTQNIRYPQSLAVLRQQLIRSTQIE